MTIGKHVTVEQTVSINAEDGDLFENVVLEPVIAESDDFAYYQILSFELTALDEFSLTLRNINGTNNRSFGIDVYTDFSYDLPDAPTLSLTDSEIISKTIDNDSTETFTAEDFSEVEIFSDDLRSLNEDFPVYVESVNHIFETYFELDGSGTQIEVAEDINADLFKIKFKMIGRSP